MAPLAAWLSKSLKVPQSVTTDAPSAALPNIMDSVREGPINSHAELALKDSKSSEIGVPNGPDSGYASAATTPDKGTSTSLPVFTDSVTNPTRKLFPRRKSQLKSFDREIPEAVQNRFSDLVELLEKPLYDHVSKSRNPVPTISIKLMVLGENEETAKPWIVIQCQQSVSLKVKQFFNQQDIKSEYQPQNVADSLPRFELVVVNRSIKHMAARVFIDCHPLDCYGTLIKIEQLAQTRFARLGGLISITTDEGLETIYGMTAGHVALAKLQIEDESQGLIQAEDEDDQTIDAFLEEEEFEIDENYLRRENVAELHQLERYEADKAWWEIGNVHASSYDYEDGGSDLDWALLQVDDTVMDLLQMDLLNYLRLSGPSPFTKHTASKMEVEVLIAGSPRMGMLSTAFSFLRTGSARVFTKTYSLTLVGDSQIFPGDCGSWVVSVDTREVLGHIVAIDAFNEIYVIPMQEMLKDMKERLGVASAALLTAANCVAIAMDTSDEVVPDPDTNKPPSGYDSGYVTMKSSPARPQATSFPNPSKKGEETNPFLGLQQPSSSTGEEQTDSYLGLQQPSSSTGEEHMDIFMESF